MVYTAGRFDFVVGMNRTRLELSIGVHLGASFGYIAIGPFFAEVWW